MAAGYAPDSRFCRRLEIAAHPAVEDLYAFFDSVLLRDVSCPGNDGVRVQGNEFCSVWKLLMEKLRRRSDCLLNQSVKPHIDSGQERTKRSIS